MTRGLLLALLALSTGCGAEETEATPPGPVPCADFELALPDGSCTRPGVPLDGCGEGFAHDGVYGCEPILPAEPCPPGLMAVPGDDACRAVMECGQGTWGDLPVDGSTQYVDGSFAGTDADGSETKPWPTIGQGVTAAAPGALIAVAAGTYSEAVLIRDKPVRLWGRCPDQVAIEATGQPAGPCQLAPLCILDGADGTEVGGLSLSGAGWGIMTTGSVDVLVDRVRIHDNVGRGVDAEDSLGPTAITLRGSLIEQNHDYGLFNAGAEVTVETSLVRSTLPQASTLDIGMGLYAQSTCSDPPSTGQCNPPWPTSVSVTRSLIEQNHAAALFVLGAHATVETTVLRNTLPRASNQGSGCGIQAQPYCFSTPSGTQCDATARASVTVARSLIEQNHTYGVLVVGADAVIDTAVVRATWPTAADQTFGRGVHVDLLCLDGAGGWQCDLATGSTAAVTRSLIEDNHELGLFVNGSVATVDATVVRATWPTAANQTQGRGIQVQMPCAETFAGWQCEPAARSTATVTQSLIEESYEFGLFVVGSDATVAGSVVRTTWPRASAAIFGDGLTVAGESAPASATLTNTLIADSARAGVASFGASISLADTHIRCAMVELNGEVFAGRDFALDDGGRNLCGCPTASDPCKLVSSGLQPPDAVPGSE